MNLRILFISEVTSPDLRPKPVYPKTTLQPRRDQIVLVNITIQIGLKTLFSPVGTASV